MARKVFVSILGTSFYQPCVYVKGEFSSSCTRFIQEATLEYIKAGQWGKDDCVLFLLTEKAKFLNWDKSITKRMNFSKQEEEYIGLEKILADKGLSDIIRYCDIPDGKDENEMWTVFSTLYNELKEGDELYIDLTHSFRYLPMLVLVLCNYAKFLKGIKVKHISYGNYEARNGDRAPIVDLLPLSILQDWTFAAADLIRNGNVDRLRLLAKEQSLAPLFRSRGRLEKRAVEQPMGEYVEALKEIIDNMKLCKGNAILTKDSINKVNNYKELVDEQFANIVAPIPPIIQKVNDTFNGFEETDEVEHPMRIFNGYEAAKWCYEHQLYQQALTIAHETIVTQVCCSLGFDWHIYKIRKAVGSWIRHGYKEKDWEETEVNRFALMSGENYTSLKLRNVFIWTTIHRNLLNHAGMTDDNISIDCKIINELGKKINCLIELKNDNRFFQ